MKHLGEALNKFWIHAVHAGCTRTPKYLDANTHVRSDNTQTHAHFLQWAYFVCVLCAHIPHTQRISNTDIAFQIPHTFTRACTLTENAPPPQAYLVFLSCFLFAFFLTEIITETYFLFLIVRIYLGSHRTYKRAHVHVISSLLSKHSFALVKRVWYATAQ